MDETADRMNPEMAYDPELAAIHDDMRHTREDVARTINELQERLSPNHLAREAEAKIKDATIGRVEDMAAQFKRQTQSWQQQVMQLVRDNPLPSALAAFGLGWLVLNGSSARSERMAYDDPRFNGGPRDLYYGPYDTYYSSSPDGRREPLPERASAVAEEARQRVEQGAQEVQRRAGEAVEGLQQRAGETLGDVQEQVGQTVRQARREVGQLAEDAQQEWRMRRDRVGYEAQYRMRRTQRTLDDAAQETPLVLGVMALGLGAVIGAALPPTEQENRLLGPARERVMEQAKSTVAQVREAAEETVREAQETTKAAAQEVKDTVASAAAELQEQGKQALKETQQKAQDAASKMTTPESKPNNQGSQTNRNTNGPAGSNTNPS